MKTEMKAKNESKKKTKNENKKLYSIYGVRLSESEKYVNMTLVTGDENTKEFINACVPVKSKYIKVSIHNDSMILDIPRLDTDND